MTTLLLLLLLLLFLRQRTITRDPDRRPPGNTAPHSPGLSSRSVVEEIRAKSGVTPTLAHESKHNEVLFVWLLYGWNFVLAGAWIVDNNVKRAAVA
jgi:hypothetical protein